MIAFDDGLDIPPVRPEPIPPLKSMCRGGPWHGARITHAADDRKVRYVDGAHPGTYRFDGVMWLWYADEE